MVAAGFEVAGRILGFPTPVVVAAPGHAIAMGFFLLLSGDYRIGVRGPAKLTANEAAIGMTLPVAATEITRLRVAPGHYDRVLALAEPFTPEQGVGIGILDEVVEGPELLGAAHAVAVRLASTLDFSSHHSIKLLTREAAIDAVRTSVEIFRTQGLV
jgi:enoyl-CoA hydratase